jgi:predicted Rossmann fold nucleotide-binding protein DprA/Smf involved in DNA uptake
MDGDTHATRILARLGRGGATRDELARALGVDVAQLALPLFELELSGFIGADRNGHLVLRAPGGS